MGFNPFRKQDRRPADVIMVAAAVLVTLAVVAWAVWGG